MTRSMAHPESRMIRPALLLMLGLWLFIPAGTAGAQQNAEEWYQAGFQRGLEGKRDQAVEAFLQALRLKPGWAEVHHQLGVLYFEGQQGPAAVFHLREAERAYQDRQDSQARRNLQAVRRNLKKAYARLQLDSEAFDRAEFKTPAVAQGWAARGAGFLVGRHGHVLVSYHSVRDARGIRVRFADGETVAAELVQPYIVFNIAVLRFKERTADRSGLTLDPSTELASGDVLFAADFSKWEGTDDLVQTGPLLEVNAVDQGRNVFQIGIPLENEFNGSPLFNSDGHVVGMLFSEDHIRKTFEYFMEAPENASFALKSDYLLKILPNIPEIDREALRPAPHAAPSPSPATESNRFSDEVRKNLVLIETQS